MKRARDTSSFPFDVLGKDGKEPGHALSTVRSPKDLHQNLVSFLRSELGCCVSVEPSTSGPYLNYPVIDSSTRAEMKSLLGKKRVAKKTLDYYLCGLCEPICVAQVAAVLDGRDATLADWAAESPVGQLKSALSWAEKAGFQLAPWMLGEEEEGWAASLRMWSALPCRTIASVCDVTAVRIEQLMLGHPACIALTLLRDALSEDSAFAIPLFVVNYLLDERRHELHVVAALVRNRALVIIDPNGVVPEDFGEPNAVMLELPWNEKNLN